jgi:multiple sugar transport system permease protein
VLIFFALVFLYPFVIQLANTFKTESDAANDPLSPVPHPFTTASFLKIFDGTDFPRWMLNSVVIAIIVTLSRVFFDSLAGYALARLRFRGRAGIFATIVAIMSVPGVVLMIPKFLVLNQLGLYDTYGALILPLMIDATGIFIMKQMFESIPVQVEEAARIDGAGIFRTYWSVVLPMARPALITLTILSFQGVWNEFPHTLVAIQSPQYFTLPRGLADLVSGSLGAGTQYPLKLGAALLATIPIAIIFLIFQRYFVRGANEGAVKG